MELKLLAEIRAKNEKLAPDQLAGILYGRGLESVQLKLNYNVFNKLFAEAGESNLISLSLDGQEFPVLVKATQKDVIKNTFIHVDFYKVNMKEKVRAEVPLEFVGESKAVKELSGVFIANIDEISIECLPADLVDHIDVDISNLNEFGDLLRLSDVNLPKGMEILNHEGNEVVCVVEEPKKVVVEEVAAAEVAPVTPEEEAKSTPEAK